jgi:NADH dehydrogenase FAD-containing subunit
MTDRKKIVIIGANFAGLACAMKLSSPFAVTVIDPSDCFEFLPNIHELLSGVKTADLLRLPRARILHRMGHRFVKDRVTGIDAGGGVVSTASGERFDFDACVVAVGGVNNTFDVPGVEQFTLPFKSVNDCAQIGRRLGELAEAGKPLSIVIVGGGLEGIEATGEILRRYRHLPDLSVHLVEASKTLISGGASVLSSEIQRRCRPYAVTFHLGDRVKAVTKTRVRLASGKSLKTDLTLWTGGAAPSPLLFGSGLSTRSDEWAAVEPTLQSCVFKNVFVIGDAAGLQVPVSKQAYNALDMGSHAAANVRRFLEGCALKPFKPGPDISLISLGDIDTYLVLGRRVFAGPALAPGKELIFQANMARLDPPLRLPAAMELQARYWLGIRELAIPFLWPPSSLKRLADLRRLA